MKIEKVTVIINGKTLKISKTALPMAQRHFGAQLIAEKSLNLPFELKNVPLIQPPKLTKEEPVEVKEPQIVEAHLTKDGEAEVTIAPVKKTVKRKTTRKK